MNSRAYRNRLAVCAAVTILAAAPVAEAQQDSITAHTDTAIALPGNSAGGMPLILGGAAGWGALHSPCTSCNDTRPGFEVAAGVRITRALTLVLARGGAAATDSEDPGVDWTTLSFRFRPAPQAGLFLQAGAGRVHASRDHTYTEEYTDLLSCDWQIWFVIPVPTDCATSYRNETEYVRTSGLAALLGFGVEVPVGRDRAIVPELRVMPGHAGLTGFSIGMYLGGTRPLLRSDKLR